MFDNENTSKKVLLASAFGAGTAIVSSLILVLLSALIFNFTPDPKALISPVGKVILYITCIAGGYIAMLKGEKLASPIISGGIMAVFILLISMLTQEISESSPAVAAVSYIFIPLSFLAGGLARHLISSKRPTRKRRRR